MSIRKADRLKVIAAVDGGKIKLTQAASKLGPTTRQLRRLVRRYDVDGAAGLISRAGDRSVV